MVPPPMPPAGAPFSLSARDLASLAAENACPACFRIRLLTRGRLPYVIPPPALVHTVDHLAKSSVRYTLDHEGHLPPWMPRVGEVTGYVWDIDHRWFRVKDPETNIMLVGVPDDILVLDDGTCHIVDYKAAHFTASQEPFVPMYEAQLNVYAYLANRLHPYVPGPVSGLTLLYLEAEPAPVDEGGNPALHFNANARPVLLVSDELIPELLRWAREIYDAGETVLRHREGCREFERLEKLVEAQTGDPFVAALVRHHFGTAEKAAVVDRPSLARR